MIITSKWLRKVTQETRGSLNREQVLLLGCAYPLSRGWRYALIGQELAEERSVAVAEAGGPGIKKRKAAKFHAGGYDSDEFKPIYTRKRIDRSNNAPAYEFSHDKVVWN